MDVFSPSNLPGVGMGDLGSLVAVLGLLGMAVTSGVLVAQGALGTLVFSISAVAVLSEKDDFGGSVPASLAVVVLLLLAAAARWLLEVRAARERAALAGAAADAPETKAARVRIVRRERWAQALAILAVLAAGAAAGFAWAEWNEVPFRLDDGEAAAGLVIGLVAASIGGDAAWRFLHGAVRAGGSAGIVGTVLVLLAWLLNAASVYVPFAGGVVFLLVVVLALRLRRRQQQTTGGLRILNG
jgi:hypothetical protein